MKKRYKPLLLAMILALPASTQASNDDIELNQQKTQSEQIDSTVTLFSQLENSVLRYYVDNLTWPTSLNQKTNTPFGDIVTINNGSNFQLKLQFQAGGEAIAKKLADQLDATVNGKAVVLTLTPPTTNALVDGLLHRHAVAGKPELQRFETAIDLNSHDINNANSVTATTVTTDTATLQTLTSNGDAALNNLTATGNTSLTKLSVNGDATFQQAFNVDSTLTTNDLTATSITATSTQANTLITGNAQLGNTVIENGATINGTLTANGNINVQDVNASNVTTNGLTVSGTLTAEELRLRNLKNINQFEINNELKQGGRFVLDKSGNLYDSGMALSQRYASLNSDNEFTGNNSGNMAIVQGKASATSTKAGRVAINGNDLSLSLISIENSLADNDRLLNSIDGMKVARLKDVDTLNSNVSSLERKASDLDNRTGSVESHVNKAKKTADDALTSTKASQTAAINNGNKINDALNRVADLEQFERDCRAQKNGLCKPNKPPKPLQWKCQSGYREVGGKCHKEVVETQYWGQGGGFVDCLNSHIKDDLYWSNRKVASADNGRWITSIRHGWVIVPGTNAEWRTLGGSVSSNAKCQMYNVQKRWTHKIGKISYCPSGYYKSGNECKAY